MNKKRRIISGMNVGSSSILVTFVLLCLVTFAALSFVSSNSDHKLSLQASERMQNYYDANRMAEVFLLNIDSQLHFLANDCETPEEYYDNIKDTFSDNNTLTAEVIDGINYISYEVVISNTQKLCVNLQIVYPETETSDPFIIKRWETVSTYSGEEGAADDGMGFIF